MKKFWQDLFTGRDGMTYDIGRVLWFQSIQVYVLISIYALYKGNPFDPVLWGAGLAALITGGGASLSIKANTEPSAPAATYTETVAKAGTDAVSIRESQVTLERSMRKHRDVETDEDPAADK